MQSSFAVVALTLTLATSAVVTSAAEKRLADTKHGDAAVAAYFQSETQKLADACLADIKSFDDWTSHRDEYRQQLQEMLGLDPLPERTPLQPVITGKIDHGDFTVENLHFQSRPHLYVTGN